MRTISSRVWYTCTKRVGSWFQRIIPGTVFSSPVRIKVLGGQKSKVIPQSHLVAMAVAPGNGDVYVLVCLCTGVELAVCYGLFCAATAGCSLRVFIPFLIPPWGFALVHGLVHVSGTALWGTMEVVVLKWFFISWGMFLESGNQTLPADMDCLGSAPTCCGSEVASHGFAQAQEGCWPCGFTLAVPISPLT